MKPPYSAARLQSPAGILSHMFPDSRQASAVITLGWRLDLQAMGVPKAVVVSLDSHLCSSSALASALANSSFATCVSVSPSRRLRGSEERWRLEPGYRLR